MELREENGRQMTASLVGVVGAAGNTGAAAVAAARAHSLTPIGFSRAQRYSDNLEWQQLTDEPKVRVPLWIDAGPIVTFHERRDSILRRGAKKIVAISSTSLFTKAASTSSAEAKIAQLLEASEQDLASWCATNSLEWVILRPTLIYGSGRDRNVREIAALIRRFGVFPLLGGGKGRRQPIHAADLGSACVGALLSRKAVNRAYNVSGGEILTYRQMVERVFQAIGRPALMPSVPLTAFRLALALLRRNKRFAHWTPEMAERMNLDMVFDHSEATEDFAFRPRPFTLEKTDL